MLMCLCATYSYMYLGAQSSLVIRKAVIIVIASNNQLQATDQTSKLLPGSNPQARVKNTTNIIILYAILSPLFYIFLLVN